MRRRIRCVAIGAIVIPDVMHTPALHTRLGSGEPKASVAALSSSAAESSNMIAAAPAVDSSWFEAAGSNFGQRIRRFHRQSEAAETIKYILEAGDAGRYYG